MAACYRLKDVYRIGELGFGLAEGVQILSPEAFSPIAGATLLVEEGRAQARAIVADAETRREEERRRGYAEGLAQGRLEAVERTLREARTLDRRLEALEQDLTDIVMMSMRKLIDGFDDAARAEAVVRGALKQMRREKKAELRVAPAQLAHFRTAVEGIRNDFPGFDLIEIVEDATLAPSSVVVETAVGRVEGDLASRVDALEAIVRGLLPGGPAETDDRPGNLLEDAAAEPGERNGDEP